MTNIHDSVIDRIKRAAEDKLLADIPAAHHDHIRNTPFPLMVRNLAKPGEQIVETLSKEKEDFVALLDVVAEVINAGALLDAVKKQVVYNKEDVPDPKVIDLPGLQGATEAFDLITPEKAHLLHMAIGVAGEAAELLEAVFNHIVSAQPLDVENIQEETGDLLFYLQGVQQQNQSFGLAMFANKVKLLGKRYKNGYSDAAAQARADKAEGQ